MRFVPGNLFKNEDEVFPLTIMVSLEPVSFKSVKNLPDLYGNIKENKFFVYLIVFYNSKNKAFEISLTIQPFKVATPPIVVVDNYKNISTKKARQAINYPFTLFEPFKRAILAFEKRSYSLEEFSNTLKNWRESLELIK